MRKYQHISLLVKQNDGVGNKTEFADLIMEDFKQSSCMVYGENADEELVLLAELKTQLDTIKLNSGVFQQSIEFVVEGKITNDQYPAITYSVNGATVDFMVDVQLFRKSVVWTYTWIRAIQEKLEIM